MFKKLLGRLTTKLFPYWCPYCPKRYRTEVKFHAHYLLCEGRKSAQARERAQLAAIAPKNREQKRKMAKKAGMIKDWGKLNAP